MTIDEIKSALHARAADCCAHLFPAGTLNGDEYEVGSLAGEPGRSLKINVNGKAGVWKDFATDDGGDNLLELWRATRGLTIEQAMNEAATWLGSPPRQNGPALRSRNFRSDEIPTALHVPAAHPTLGCPSARWLYGDEPNAFVVYRFETGKNSKTFRPFAVALGQWREPEQTPLYRRSELLAQPAADVLIVAGEKAANAARERGFLATTVMGGEAKVTKADLEPLRGRTVYAWRDADRAGEKWLAALAAASARFGFELRAVPLPTSASDGQDIADLIDADGWSDDDIRAQLDMAEPVGTPPEPTGRFRLLTDEDLERQPDLPDLVQGTFPAASLIVLAAQPATAKTTLALELAGDVGCDLLFHGRAVTPGTVVFVAAEGAAKLGLRVRAWKSWRKVPKASNVYFLAEPVHFGDASEVDALLVALQKLPRPPVLVVVDTLARCMIGADENSARDVGDFVNGCDRIRRATAAAVLIVHHTTKTGSAERGSGALRGAADTLVMMSREDDLVTVTCEKQKDGAPFEPLHFRLRVVELGNERTACVLDPAEKPERASEPPPPGKLPESRRRVLDALTNATDGATFAQWQRLAQETARVSESTFQRAVKDLVAWKRVTKRGERYFPGAAS